MDTPPEAPIFEPVEVTYRLSDLYAANLQHWRTYFRGLVVIELILLCIAIGLPMIDGESIGEAVSWIDWKLHGILGLLLLVVWTVLPPLAAYFLKLRPDRTPYRFALLQAGVNIVGSDSEGTVYWSSLKKVILSDSRLYLVTPSGSAFILPRRSFASDVEFQGWCDYALSRWQADRKN